MLVRYYQPEVSSLPSPAATASDPPMNELIGVAVPFIWEGAKLHPPLQSPFS